MTRLPLALAGLVLAAAPAAADVTPREVWDGWLATLEEGEAEVATRSVEETGDGLVVTGLSIVSGNDDGGSYALEIDELSLAANGDGTVGVTVTPEYPLVLSGTDDDGAEHETHLLVRHPDLDMTVAEEDGMRQHAFAAPEIRVAIIQVLEDGEPLDLSGTLVFQDAVGNYDTGDAGMGQSAFAAARIAFEMEGSDPESGEDFTASVDVEGFDSANMLQIVGTDTAGLARRLPDDETIEGSFSAASTTFDFESVSAAETAALAGKLGPSDAHLGLSAEGLSYSTESQDLALTFSGSSIPLPEVTFAVGSTNLGFKAPLLADEDPQPFALRMSLLDFALDDGLWNMVDPAGILPRDPGAITLDLSGEMVVDEDIQARTADDAGDEFRSLALNTARVAFADAEVDAAGNLSLEESPAGDTFPVGQIDVTLTGATRLLERLVQAGIIPQQQATGTRMMLSMFAAPGDTDGELVSTIRFTEDGHVFVNDQQVR